MFIGLSAMFGAALLLGSTVFGALAFRIRGGFIPTGSSQLARVIYATIMTLVAMAVSFDWRLATLLPAFFLGAIFPWFNSIDLGRNEGVWWKDAFLMLCRGSLFTVFTVPMLWYFDQGVWFGAVGLLCPVAYEIGWRIPSKTVNFRQGPEMGEAIFGAILGFGLALTLI